MNQYRRPLALLLALALCAAVAPPVAHADTPLRVPETGGAVSGAASEPIITPLTSAVSEIPAPRHINLRAAGISARVRDLRCGIPKLPNGRVWNWRCADPSNPTLLAHAWGSFRALSRAYDRGRLDRGVIMRVRGADGLTRRYRLAWTRIVRKERLDWWAFGATDVPSLTLITCRGRHSTHRLVVRFELVRP